MGKQLLPQKQPASPQKLNRKQRRAAKKNSNLHVVGNATSPAINAEILPLLNHAVKLQHEGNLEGAKEIYESLLLTHAEDLNFRLCLADFYDVQGDLDQSYVQYKKAVTLQPDNAICWRRLSVCLKKRSDLKASIIACRKAIELEPNDADLLAHLAALLGLTYDPKSAAKALEAALKLDPENYVIHQAFGDTQTYLGRFDEAAKSYRRALELEPNELVVRYSLSEARGISAADYDSEIKKIDRILASKKDLSLVQRASGLFVTADILDKQKDFEGAFTYYKRANDVVRREHKFDCARHTELIDQLIDVFTLDALEALKAAGNDSQLPVLVVGMPRSGTTLVEQILGSHSQVFGASEMPQIERIDYDLRTSSTHSEIKFPQHITAMNTEALSQIAATHITFLHNNVSSDARRIIDKLPTNFMRLGLFALLFPNAKIIHCERDPMASCWSCFTKNFQARAPLSFTLDLSDLGYFYREYERMMKHWHAVLPGSILDVSYEQLIHNPRDISEAMISHIGLDWEESCLKFNEQNTVVQSASTWQVRQPIYTSANEKWRRYEDYLTPLKQALEGKFV